MTDQVTKVTYQDMVILARQGSFYIMRATLPVAEEIAHMQATGAVDVQHGAPPGHRPAPGRRPGPGRDDEPDHRQVRPADPAPAGRRPAARRADAVPVPVRGPGLGRPQRIRLARPDASAAPAASASAAP